MIWKKWRHNLWCWVSSYTYYVSATETWKVCNICDIKITEHKFDVK